MSVDTDRTDKRGTTDADKLRFALLRYRVLAWVTGTGLVVLVGIGIPLQLFGHDVVVAIVGPLHGFVYLVYLVTALDLAIRCRWSIAGTVAVMAAGTIPFVSFYAERKVTHRVSRMLPVGEPAGGVADGEPETTRTGR